MAIYNEYTIKIVGAKAILDKEIILTRGDKNIDLYFSIEGFDFKCKTGTYTKAEFSLLKPNNDMVFLTPTLESEKIHVTISEDILDESIEVGTYSFQISLYSNDTSKVSVPIVYNQFHVFEALGTNVGASNEADNSLTNSAYTTSTNVNTPVLNDDGTFNKKVWGDKNVISSEKLNQYENAFDMIFDNTIVTKTVTDNLITLDTSKFQQATINNDVTIILPSITYNTKFYLLLECTQTVNVTFKTTSDIQTTKLDKNYYALELVYIGDWIIKQ